MAEVGFNGSLKPVLLSVSTANRPSLKSLLKIVTAALMGMVDICSEITFYNTGDTCFNLYFENDPENLSNLPKVAKLIG